MLHADINIDFKQNNLLIFSLNNNVGSAFTFNF